MVIQYNEIDDERLYSWPSSILLPLSSSNMTDADAPPDWHVQANAISSPSGLQHDFIVQTTTIFHTRQAKAGEPLLVLHTGSAPFLFPRYLYSAAGQNVSFHPPASVFGSNSWLTPRAVCDRARTLHGRHFIVGHWLEAFRRRFPYPAPPMAEIKKHISSTDQRRLSVRLVLSVLFHRLQTLLSALPP
ncbi:hypothetical protein BST61_g8640 [Cercospora zeina]